MELPPWQVAWAGYFTLNFMYTKFLVIWRFFRLWSLSDGIVVVDNMPHCINYNFTFQGFWRQWHSSLNQWIIRYLYIPLGGGKSQMWSMWIIFTFIGLWHDLWWRWVAWAWFNCVFFSAEMLILKHLQSARYDWARANPIVHRRLVALLASFNLVGL